MGYKMKGFGGFKEESPAKQKDKKVIGENTGEIKKDKKGNEYALSMYDNASGINQGDTLFVSPKSDNNTSPFETLSPIFTLIFSTVPSSVEGTSTLDLSLSKVTIESFFFILSPDLTKISMISTFSKSPISGTTTLLNIQIFA